MQTKFFILFIMAFSTLNAQSFAPHEVGEFLKKASMFVTWPEPYAGETNFTIGIIAEPKEIAQFTKYFEHSVLKSLPVKIVAVKPNEAFTFCHSVLILKKLAPDEITKLKSMRNKPILIISTVRQQTTEPCQIFLEKTNNKTAFTISESGIKNSGLQVSYILFSEAEVIDKLNY